MLARSSQLRDGVSRPVKPDPDGPPLCKVCKMAAIPGCRNTLDYPSGGAILLHRGDRLVSVDCPNMRIVSLRQRLIAIDGQFLQVKHNSQTPLFQAGQVDRTEDNLFVRHAEWLTFLAHFKWVIASKPPGFFVRVVTDMTLLNVYLGHASVKNRLQSQREDGELLISNSLEDLLSSPDLAVIRLGHVIHSNRAAANILREAINLRLGRGRPTWLVEPREQTFMPQGMPCCDDNVLALVQATFEEVHLAAAPEARPAYVHEDGEVTVGNVSPLEEIESPVEEVEDGAPEGWGEEEPYSGGGDEVNDLINQGRSPSKRRLSRPVRRRP